MKIINHDRNVGNNFDAMRESVLCSNINHPNVVMTYKASLPASICGAARSAAMRYCKSCGAREMRRGVQTCQKWLRCG